MKRVILLSMLLVALTNISATIRQNIDNLPWQFIRIDMAGQWEVFRPAQVGKPESVPLWTDVTLPHCWNSEDAVDPDCNYYQGAGWYRTSLIVNNPYANGRTLLEFEGAGQKTEVYIGLQKAGSHIGGYDKWSVDITSYGDTIPLAIRCDNSRDREMIPSDMSDFCLYGGLYRHVNLIYQPEDYISEDCITTDGNKVIINAPHSAWVMLTSPNGKTIYKGRNTGSIFVKNPQLWDVDKPCLYTISVRYGEQQFERKIGFRSYEFQEHGPFFLNGKRLLLKGTHRHEDQAGVGAAMTDDMIRREMLQIKDMGANFIRLGHYQQSDLVLNLCDSLGIIVWEEIPWCRGGLGGNRYKAQARQMLTNMISQHRHHPSVILWGGGQ